MTTKTTKHKGPGRPPIYPKGRIRHNLNVERSTEMDQCLLRVRQIMALQDGVDVKQVTQTKAIRYALYIVANRLPVPLPNENGEVCPKCNGLGHIAIRNGDDDVACDECSNEDTEHPHALSF